MAVEIISLPAPTSADPSSCPDFGREIRGINPNELNEEEFKLVSDLLYKHGLLLFRNCNLTPAQQYTLTKCFDPASENYGHGNKKVDQAKTSILHAYLKSIPAVPQVQLIGNGTVYDHEGISEVKLKHASHTVCHKTTLSEEEVAQGYTRFFRWHIDAALYELSPPKVTTLYAIRVPQGPNQTVRYDDGTGDELQVPVAPTAFVSTKRMFDMLPQELKSVAVRGRVKYAPHPYVWMSTAKLVNNGLSVETEGREVPYNELPPWDESKIKVHPMLWKNLVTGDLHFQVHPTCAAEVYIDPLAADIEKDGALFPEGAHITDLREVRALLYEMQRPAIAPEFVYPHDWSEKDLIIFHNRGLLHCIAGSLSEEQVRVFHQCNLAGSDDPTGPTNDDIKKWA
ncbi:Clavaminate synthase-like protein [Neolentinus lepideus HHB14362 ss-1]|uniref:Clavaminate synthase-like protein n=1 Tax=Neolentinus lepideus HHB14362 ss-1 TaxID=1314782 RepID=A0A165Q5Q6_9AGAM|nr:Clavaminate synthase-like protein [Neolentinus lepideus HHB14362 ss-1]